MSFQKWKNGLKNVPASYLSVGRSFSGPSDLRIQLLQVLPSLLSPVQAPDLSFVAEINSGCDMIPADPFSED